jgi:hypothetical protein
MARNVYANKSTRINVKQSVHLIAGLLEGSEIRNQMLQAVDLYGDDILAELETFDTLRDGDAQYHAQRCVIFAIISPQCDFDLNCRAAVRFHNALYSPLNSVNDVYRVLTNDGECSWFTAGMSARSLFHNLQWLRNLDESDMNKPAIMALGRAGVIKGLAHKTASMAVALFDGREEVYTLDIHMLRGICRCAGAAGLEAGQMSITKAAHPGLEQTMVEIHAEILPEYPTFVSQWALWNLWRSDEHISHLPIFE